nr:PAS domain-containing protein [Telluribacter sp. SYSU D00476]
MLVLWGEDHVLFYNDAVIPGLDPERHPVLGQPVREVWEQEWAIVEPVVKKVLHSGEPVSFQDIPLTIYRHGQAEKVFCTFSVSQVLNDEGAPGGVLVTCLETTHDVLTHKSLEVSEKRFQDLVKEAAVGIIVLTGEEMRVDIVNETYAQLIGRSQEELIGKELFKVIPEVEAYFRPNIDLVKRTGKPLYLFETPYSVQGHKGPIEGYLNLVYQPYRESDGTIRDVIVFCNEVTEQVRAMQRNEERQQQLLSLFEQSQVGIAILEGENLIFRMANPFYGQLVDRAPEQLIGKPLLEALPELVGQGFNEQLQKVITTGVPFVSNEVAAQVVRNNQLQTIYVNITFQPHRRVENGPIVGVFVVATDVTQQVKARQALHAEQIQLNTILREVPVGILIANPNGELIYGNPQVEQIFRHPFRVSKDIEAYKNWALFDPLTGDPFPLDAMPMVRTLLHGETVVGVEMKLKRGDGTWGYASVNTVPVYDDQGQLLLGVAAFIDITARKQAEEALRLSESRLRAVLESISDGLYIGGLEGITLVNQAALDQLGFTTAAELNRHIGTLAEEIQTRDWQTGEFIPVERQAFARAMGGEHVVQDVRVRHRLSGEERVVRCAASPVVVEGKVVAAVAINSDVTSQRQAEEALRQSEERYRQLSKELENRVQARTQELQIANLDLTRSNANLKQFAYVASHDLQEPLRKIQSFSTLLQKKYSTELGPQGFDLLSRIVKAGERMSTLI